MTPGRHRRAGGHRPRAASTPPGSATWRPTRCARAPAAGAGGRRRLRRGPQLQAARAARDRGGGRRPGCARRGRAARRWWRTCAACRSPTASSTARSRCTRSSTCRTPNGRWPRWPACCKPGGAAVVVTPNRLTFARPDEIIDPYHYVEFDPGQLALAVPGASGRWRWPASSVRRATGSSCARAREAGRPAAAGPAAPAAAGAAPSAPAAVRLAAHARARGARSRRPPRSRWTTSPWKPLSWTGRSTRGDLPAGAIGLDCSAS